MSMAAAAASSLPLLLLFDWGGMGAAAAAATSIFDVTFCTGDEFFKHDIIWMGCNHAAAEELLRSTREVL